ncbi:hypothetical protein [Abyssibacter profundi]|uniref:Uncharacterized protein n=1 Tax=Abyssibacter profundi TaxID=2182787 RepID=A0A363ULB4_9GAMM|nr:hypothetical protein [Abyssibacter profundi]PWN56208.1 hypothetical protein DEH80_08010 [Abyssibacter profundi]
MADLHAQLPDSPLRLHGGQTAWVVAPGPSAATALLHCLPPQATIAVGGAFELVPAAAAIYAADIAWWDHYHPHVSDRSSARRFAAGLRSVSPAVYKALGLEPIWGVHQAGPSPQPHAYIHFGASGGGANSGAQAIEMARCWGARRIVLVGFDLCDVDGQRYGCERPPPTLWRADPLWARKQAVVDALCLGLAGQGITLINTSPVSVIAGTTRSALCDELGRVAA